MRVTKSHLSINPFSNPGTLIKEILGVVIHWVKNPGTDNNHTYRYFEGLKNQENQKSYRYASAHYGVDPTGIMQYVPEEYVTYNVGAKKYTEFKNEFFGAKYPNAHVISIEFHHPDWSGKPEAKTYKYLIDLSMNLCDRYNLDPRTQIIRHFDVTGKDCPLWYVNNPELFKSYTMAVYNNLLLWKDRDKLEVK